jgi:hypothetical protein
MREDALEADYQRELTELDLQHGETYYLLVRAVNGVGLTSVTSAGPVTVDTTRPVGTELREISVGKDGRSANLELQARDPESGLASFRWEVIQGGIRGVSSPDVLYNSGWQSFTGAGTKSTVKREIVVTIPASARGRGKTAPRVRVWVVNGADLTAKAGTWIPGAGTTEEPSTKRKRSSSGFSHTGSQVARGMPGTGAAPVGREDPRGGDRELAGGGP